MQKVTGNYSPLAKFTQLFVPTTPLQRHPRRKIVHSLISSIISIRHRQISQHAELSSTAEQMTTNNGTLVVPDISCGARGVIFFGAFPPTKEGWERQPLAVAYRYRTLPFLETTRASAERPESHQEHDNLNWNNRDSDKPIARTIFITVVLSRLSDSSRGKCHLACKSHLFCFFLGEIK